MHAVDVAIIGGGPAGLRAAEEAVAEGARSIAVYDQMPTMGRKLLMAGKSGLNLSHSEKHDHLIARYGESAAFLKPILEPMTSSAIRKWCDGHRINTFVGSSGRIFPKNMKASPLLRALLGHLREADVGLHVRHRWTGWDDEGALTFDTPDGAIAVHAKATILALGGASWARLGSDGAWTGHMDEKILAPFSPSNCGFDVAWSNHFKERYAGSPLKLVRLSIGEQSVKGDCIVTEGGLEGSAVYNVSRTLVQQIEKDGSAQVMIDLMPNKTHGQLVQALEKPRGKNSLSNHLRKKASISGVKAGLLREAHGSLSNDMTELATQIKAAPIAIARHRPLDEAISTAGGVKWDALTPDLMLKNKRGVFCAGEMMDWDAPTGGYLLTACLATGRHAGAAAALYSLGN